METPASQKKRRKRSGSATRSPNRSPDSSPTRAPGRKKKRRRRTRSASMSEIDITGDEDIEIPDPPHLRHKPSGRITIRELTDQLTREIDEDNEKLQEAMSKQDDLDLEVEFGPLDPKYASTQEVTDDDVFREFYDLVNFIITTYRDADFVPSACLEPVYRHLHNSATDPNVAADMIYSKYIEELISSLV